MCEIGVDTDAFGAKGVVVSGWRSCGGRRREERRIVALGGFDCLCSRGFMCAGKSHTQVTGKRWGQPVAANLGARVVILHRSM